MKRERASVVCVHKGKLLTVLLRDPVTHTARLFVPGGAIEAAESPAQAAVRETLEETGYHVTCLPRAALVAHYPFVWAGRDVEDGAQFLGRCGFTHRGCSQRYT